MIDRNFVVKKILEMTSKKEMLWEPVGEDYIVSDFENIRLCMSIKGKIPVWLAVSERDLGLLYRLNHELLGEILDHALIGIDNEIGKPEVLGIFYDRYVEREKVDPTATRIAARAPDAHD